MYDAVIFDLDGTLTDSKEGIYACTEYALKKLGKEIPPAETLRRFLGPPLADSFMRFCGMTEEEAALATEVYRERYNPIGWKENAVFPGIRALIKGLKDRGVYVAVATGKPQRASENILEYFGLTPYLDAVAGPSLKDMHADKAELIRRVLPEGKKAVMVGDAVSDLEGARQCGIDSAAALYGYGEEKELLSVRPTHTVRNVRELTDILCPGLKTRGCFITLEGVDGCGKSTQAAALQKLLTQFGYTVRRTREPGGCPIAEEIRKIVLAKEDGGMCPETEALLFAAARAQHVREVILPAVKNGEIVLCDRFVDSSIVYQGNARGLAKSWIESINQAALKEGLPDVTLYLRMSHTEALKRRLAVSDPDRIEQMGDAFLARTEDAYEELLRENPGRYLPVNAAQAPEDVTKEAFEKLFDRLIREGVY